jgi:hypothetical protein
MYQLRTVQFADLALEVEKNLCAKRDGGGHDGLA